LGKSRGGRLRGMGLTITGRQVLNRLMEYGPGGASINELAVDLDMPANQVQHVLARQLEPVGEAFQAGGKWVATDAVLALKYSPKIILERLNDELQRALFDGGNLPDHVKMFLEEFASAKNLSLSTEEAVYFAERRVLRVET